MRFPLEPDGTLERDRAVYQEHHPPSTTTARRSGPSMRTLPSAPSETSLHLRKRDPCTKFSQMGGQDLSSSPSSSSPPLAVPRRAPGREEGGGDCASALACPAALLGRRPAVCKRPHCLPTETLVPGKPRRARARQVRQLPRRPQTSRGWLGCPSQES